MLSFCRRRRRALRSRSTGMEMTEKLSVYACKGDGPTFGEVLTETVGDNVTRDVENDELVQQMREVGIDPAESCTGLSS